MELGKTPIKANRLEYYLKFYPNQSDAKILIDGFTNGFKVNYQGPCVPLNCKNLISAEQHEGELQVKLAKEIEAGRIAGPFNERSFPNLRLSPLGLVAKKPSLDQTNTAGE